MIEYRQLATILSLFLIVQLFGLLVAFYLISPSQVYISTTPTSSSELLFYFLYIVIAAVIMVLLFRIYRGNVLFRVIEGVVVVSAAFYLFLIILGTVLPQNGGAYAVFISLILSIGLIVAKNKWPQLRNLAAVIASIGVGVVLGSYFSFFAAYALMAFIAAYDYIAVFVTRHMVALGREAVNRNLAFMIGSYDIEVVPKKYLNEKEIKELKKSLNVRKIKSPELKRLIEAGNFPVPSFSALGTGDLAIPLMLAISAYVTYFRYFTSLLIILGATIGLILAMYISKKYKIALPAIPPLFACVSIGLGLEFFLLAPENWGAYTIQFAASIAIILLIVLTARRQSRIGLKARIG